MKNLKIAVVQYGTATGDMDANTETAMDFIREAREGQADMVLFPECFLTSYRFPDICQQLLPREEICSDPQFEQWRKAALTEEDPHLKKIRSLAGELGIGVVITAFSQGRQLPRNTAWVIDKSGRIILEYHKVHTCDFWCERYLESGTDFPVCEFDGVKLGVMICYDREYPESARELMLKGAEIILHPNCCSEMKPRLRELSVRAMENMVGIAMANPPGESMGCSCAYSPVVWDAPDMENQMAVAGEHFEGILYVDFDMKAIREYREREDLGKYRKPEAYSRLRGKTE